MSTLCWFALTFAAHATREVIDPNALAADPVASARRLAARQATRECLRVLVERSGRTDVDILQNGDLAVHVAGGVRIEKANDRGTLIDANGNCARVDPRGKIADRDSFPAIVDRGARADASTEALAICARADQDRLRGLVRSPARPGVTPGIGR